MPRKRDHTNLPHKLAIRRYYLTQYHSLTPPHVLDCCAGSGLIWRILRTEHNLASYTPLDLKPRPPRLQIDAKHYLAACPHADVIDIDTYGSPWAIYDTLAQHPPTEATDFTVFLTSTIRGSPNAPGRLPAIYLRHLGLAELAPILPIGFHPQLHIPGLAHAIYSATLRGLQILDAHLLTPSDQIVYIATRLRKSS